MAIENRHEQFNKNIKDEEGIVGLTEHKDKFHRWLLCTPEVPRVIAEFEAQTVPKNNKHHQDFHHHEDSKTFPLQFLRHVDDLKKEFEQFGNSVYVTEDCSELI